MSTIVIVGLAQRHLHSSWVKSLRLCCWAQVSWQNWGIWRKDVYLTLYPVTLCMVSCLSGGFRSIRDHSLLFSNNRGQKKTGKMKCIVTYRWYRWESVFEGYGEWLTFIMMADVETPRRLSTGSFKTYANNPWVHALRVMRKSKQVPAAQPCR